MVTMPFAKVAVPLVTFSQGSTYLDSKPVQSISIFVMPAQAMITLELL